jgi:hypothetical protein
MAFATRVCSARLEVFGPTEQARGHRTRPPYMG